MKLWLTAAAACGWTNLPTARVFPTLEVVDTTWHQLPDDIREDTKIQGPIEVDGKQFRCRAHGKGNVASEQSGVVLPIECALTRSLTFETSSIDLRVGDKASLKGVATDVAGIAVTPKFYNLTPQTLRMEIDTQATIEALAPGFGLVHLRAPPLGALVAYQVKEEVVADPSGSLLLTPGTYDITHGVMFALRCTNLALYAKDCEFVGGRDVSRCEFNRVVEVEFPPDCDVPVERLGIRGDLTPWAPPWSELDLTHPAGVGEVVVADAHMITLAYEGENEVADLVGIQWQHALDSESLDEELFEVTPELPVEIIREKTPTIRLFRTQYSNDIMTISAIQSRK